MLQVISALKGFAVDATDGRLGTVVDFLFDDKRWRVKWLVVETGSWLSQRRVLLHPGAVKHRDFRDQCFDVVLSKSAIAGSPPLLEHQPVSQHMETQTYNYYGWDPILDTSYLGGAPGDMTYPRLAPPYLGLHWRDPTDLERAAADGGDPHLRSFVEVMGYHVHAVDGLIGKVDNLMIDGATWLIHYLIVDTNPWWFGKQVLMAPGAVDSIEWSDRQVMLNVTQAQVRTSPVWDPMVAFQQNDLAPLHRHYGWPGSGQ